MEIQHLGLLATFLSVCVLLASGVRVKYIKYCGPKDKTFHVKVTPWPVATTGQEVKVTLTFTPRKDVYYTMVQYKVTAKGQKIVLKGTHEVCDWLPQFCLLPAGEKVSLTYVDRVRKFPLGFKGTYKARVEFYNQDLYMWMCFEAEGVL